MNRAILLTAVLAALLAVAGSAQADTAAAPVVSSATHPAGVASNHSVGVFSWIAPAGFESGSTFIYRLSAKALDEPSAVDNATPVLTASVVVPALGDWYFHIVATNGSARSGVAHFGPVSRVASLAQTCTAALSGDGGPDHAQLDQCVNATQRRYAPQAIMAVFIGFLAKFGSATLRRG